MARKRKSEESTPMDEADRTLYSAFRCAANSLSQLYTQAMHQQTLSFHAGERHALEKLYQWILRQHEVESRLTVADIITHIQSEIDYGGQDVSTSPMLALQQHTQSALNFMNLSLQPSSGISGQASTGSAPRGNPDQAKYPVSTSALPSPACSIPQHSDLVQAGDYYTNFLSTGSNGARNHDANQILDRNPLSSNDSSMDMHPDSPTNGSSD